MYKSLETIHATDRKTSIKDLHDCHKQADLQISALGTERNHSHLLGVATPVSEYIMKQQHRTQL